MDMCRFEYNKEKDLFLKYVWNSDVNDEFVVELIGQCLSAKEVIDRNPNGYNFKNKVFLIKNGYNIDILITLDKGSVKDAMLKLWTCDMKEFENITNSWFKEYFNNIITDTHCEIMEIERFIANILIEAHCQLAETESKDVDWIINVLSSYRNVDNASSENKEEEKKDMSSIMAVTFSRSRFGGIIRNTSFIVDGGIVEEIEPNITILHPNVFNDSNTRFTVYIDGELYDQFDKLLDRGPFFDRFVEQLGQMEFYRNNPQETRKITLAHILQNVFISLGDVILSQKKAGEKNAVLYLTNIQNKTELLLKAMDTNHKEEDPKPVESKAVMRRSHLCKQPSILSKVYETGNRIKNDRDISGIFMQAVSEIGELGEEVRIKTDKSYYRKDEGKDGILGEACDVIIAVTDLLNIAGYTLEDIDRVITSKLNKWEHKANDKKIMINIVKCDGDVGNFDYVKMYNDVNGKEARVCYIGLNTFLVINYEDGKILGSTVYEGFDKFVEFVKNCNIGDIANPGMLAKEICDMLDKKGE